MKKHYRRWVYHATEAPKIISSKDYDKHKSDGWSDTPATFAKIKDFGVDEEDPAAVQVLGEALAGVGERINGELNLEVLRKKELEDYAIKHFNYDLDLRRTKKVLQAKVRELIEG